MDHWPAASVRPLQGTMVRQISKLDTSPWALVSVWIRSALNWWFVCGAVALCFMRFKVTSIVGWIVFGPMVVLDRWCATNNPNP